MKLPHDPVFFPDKLQKQQKETVGADGSTPEERLDHAAKEAGMKGVDGKPSKDWRTAIIDKLSSARVRE